MAVGGGRRGVGEGEALEGRVQVRADLCRFALYPHAIRPFVILSVDVRIDAAGCQLPEETPGRGRLPGATAGSKKTKNKKKLCELLHGLWQQAVRESGSLSGGLQCERTWRICQEAANTPVGVRLVSGRTSVRYRFGSPFFSKRLWFVDTVP